MAARRKFIGVDWGLSGLMADATLQVPERPLKARSTIWPSELGYDFASRFLAMHGHPPTNPANERSRGKFFMGQMIEAIYGMLLKAAGLMREEQIRCEITLPGMLTVSGKCDFLAGGEGIDWDKAEHEVRQLLSYFAPVINTLPPTMAYAMTNAFQHYKRMFLVAPPNMYKIEIKSVGQTVMDLIDNLNKPRYHNWLQGGHYQLSEPKKIQGTYIYYICRDDARDREFIVQSDKELKQAYYNDVSTMTGYYNESIGKNYLKCIPPLAPEVHFVEGSYRFEKNVNVQYSKFLTMLYGYKNFEAYKDKWAKPISAYNRVFKRVVKGENITKANTEIIAEAKTVFPDWDNYVEQARKAGAFDKLEENEENDLHS
mgnify:FL=1